MTKWGVIILLLILVLVGAALVLLAKNFDILPEPTLTPTPTVTEVITPVSLGDLIQVASPLSDTKVKSPLQVIGQARGTWYFEAAFPVKLSDASGKVIAQTTAQAKADWMTEDWVPFEATLKFLVPAVAIGKLASSGYLILERDNPSGDSAFDRQLKIPVKF